METAGTAPEMPSALAPARSRRVAPIIVVAIAIVIAAFFVVLIRAKSGTNTETAYSPLVGGPAPAVETTTLDGKPFDLARRKGSWVVLNFFNATCGPCVDEHPQLVSFAEQQRSPDAIGAELYSIVWNDTGGETEQFFADNKVSWTVLEDTDARITGAFAVTKVPETWIIDPNGYVVWHAITEVTDDSLTAALNKARELYEGAA